MASFGAHAQRLVATAGGKSDSRRKMIQAVRAAARRLGLDDDDRRAKQQVAGKASLADMDLAELGRVLDHLNRDWKGPSGHRAHIGKIRALWWTLYWLGAVDQPTDRAIGAFVKRQTGIAALAFLDHRKAASVVEALKDWAAREGVEWDAAVGKLGDRRVALAAIWRKLVRGVFLGTSTLDRFVADALGVPADSARWSRHELDAAIRHVGKRLRRELDQLARRNAPQTTTKENER